MNDELIHAAFSCRLQKPRCAAAKCCGAMLLCGNVLFFRAVRRAAPPAAGGCSKAEDSGVATPFRLVRIEGVRDPPIPKEVLGALHHPQSLRLGRTLTSGRSGRSHTHPQRSEASPLPTREGGGPACRLQAWCRPCRNFAQLRSSSPRGPRFHGAEKSQAAGEEKPPAPGGAGGVAGRLGAAGVSVRWGRSAISGRGAGAWEAPPPPDRRGRRRGTPP